MKKKKKSEIKGALLKFDGGGSGNIGPPLDPPQTSNLRIEFSVSYLYLDPY